ncbi:polycomb group RING finger protein 2-like [Amphibalanus amphitrite]|uniref:polycomb group RING finger protein 2-like n=1 Tax=Amphibalanus amphitrite TaxID=1232801 RepID=UPI001C921E44|nr:polycomb group RING finger protein 2-like [Amphibalanus amphitrite]
MAAPGETRQERAVALSELTPHLVCPLCGGYYVDATAIVECLHTCPTPLCRVSCTKRYQACTVMKCSDGSFSTPTSRMPTRNSHRHRKAAMKRAPVGTTHRMTRLTPEEVVPVRYFRCPAGLPLSTLKKLLFQKYGFSDSLQMELIHGRKVLPADIKLLDVAYIINWSRTSPAVSKAPVVTTSVTFVTPSTVPVRSAAVTPVRPVSSPLHIETASLGLRYGSAVPPLSSLSRPAPSTTTTSSTSSRPVFPVPPLPQRPKSQNVRAIPNPSLLRQRSAEERARDSGKGSPTAGSTAPAMSPPTIRDIHSLTRQLQEAGTSVTITNTS